MSSRAFLVVAVLAAFLASCRRAEQEDVVARVGDSVISQADFQRKLSEVAPEYQNYVLTPHGRRQFLDVLIREMLVLEAARSAGIEGTPEFRDQMQRLRRDEEERIRAAREHLLTSLWRERLREDGTLRVTEDDRRDYHRRNGTEVIARHILLATAEEAESVIRQARSGASFAALAKKHSLDADTAEAGGQMDPALLGELVSELQVLFKMRTGEVAGPVRSSFGYHILLKEGERKAEYDAVSDRIAAVLEKEKLDAHLRSLQASHRVEVLDAQFQ